MIRMAVAMMLLVSLVEPPAAQAAKPRFIDVDLIAETARPKPGESALVGLRMVPKPGWHSYWSNPGEAGFPTLVEWNAPAGVHFGPLRHPAPSLIEVAGMASYVHEGPHVLVARMSLSRDIPDGTAIPVTAEVSWAACSDKLCVPEKATLSLQLTAGGGAKSADEPLLKRALSREPREIDGGTFDIENGKLLLELPADARLDAARARFFPDENGIADVARTRMVSASPVRISMPAASDAPKVLSGVVTDGSSTYRLRLVRKELAAETAIAEPRPEQLHEAAETPAVVRRDRMGMQNSPSPAPSRQEGRFGSWNLLAGIAAALAALAIALVMFRRARNRN